MSFDHSTMARAFDDAETGQQHIANATVDPNADPAVRFDDPIGPLVSVILHPSGLEVEARVGAYVAGNGEGEWFPFQAGDELLVAVPGGDERNGCVIIARLYNAIDVWPAQVAGQDATKNNFAFRRMQTPYILETASSWMVRGAATGAFISLTPDGQITIANADGAFLALTPDFIGSQSKDATLISQLDLHQKAFVASADGSKLVVSDKVGNSWLSTKLISIAGSGGSPFEHAASAEAIVNIMVQFFGQWSTALALIAAPLTGASLAATINPGTIAGLMNAALLAAGSATIAPYTSSIGAALALKLGVPGFPSVGSPGVLVG